MLLFTDVISQALDHLLARAAERVRAVGRGYRLDPATLDEVFQEVRVRIWRAFGGSDERIQRLPASYVYQTASAAAIDLIRRRRARRADQTETLDEVSDLSADRPADRALDAQELGDRVNDALGDLPASRRSVVRMYLAGYGRPEIGQILGWTEAKVRNLLYRGLDDLRSALARRGVGPEGIIE